MLPVNPSVTITSATPPIDVAALHVAHELERLRGLAARCAQLGVGLDDQLAAALGLLAV